VRHALHAEVTLSEDELAPVPVPWVDETAIAREHGLLFHYTGASTLKPILSTGGLYATTYKDTNDPDELHALRNPLVPLMVLAALPLLKYAQEIGTFMPPIAWDLESVAREEASKFHDIMVRALPTVPHVTCFSTHSEEHHVQNGLLTMWRLYGRGEGLALGFDAPRLVELSQEIQRSAAIDGIYLDRVLYGLGDPRLVKRIMEAPDVPQKFAETLILMLQSRSDAPQFEMQTLLRFLVLICCAKHPDFSDEREVRLIVQQALEGHERGRPRVEEPAAGRIVVKCLDALRHVMIGPNDHQDALAESVRHQLDGAGFGHVEVHKSQIQFRFV